jgi:sialate O-acetylesterase
MKTHLKYGVLALAALLVLSLVVCGGLANPPAQAGSLTTSAMFNDYAVVQRNMDVPVWGEAADGTTVTVTFNGQEKSTTASGGEWMVTLDPMAANTSPGDMVISGGGESITYTGVQVGEVWLASGQSNMWFNLNNSENGAAAKADADNHNMAMFHIWFSELTIDKSEWELLNSSTAGDSSAVAYYFGHMLSHALGNDVPIGLIQAAKGGTDIAEWTHAGGGSKDGALYEGKIVPMQPYAIRGAIWYQGENDAAYMDQAVVYEFMLDGLIDEWRTDWGLGDFPFYVVQLHWKNNSEEGWPIVRQAQLDVTQTVANSCLATAVDIPLTGQPGHPDIKEPIGTRLGLCARALVYGENNHYSGPIVDAAASYVDGSDVVLAFDHVGSGMITDDSGAPSPFKLAGSDQVYYDATAQIVGDTVVVSSGSVSNPVYVRYVWNYAQGNLVTVDGFSEYFSSVKYSDDLPAIPFEIDLSGGGPTPTPAPPTDTPVPTDTPIPPTDTPVPTDTPIPPTDTPGPTPTPSDTPVPPTDTPVPTDTPIPPTDTPAPPTDTPAPPTDTPEGVTMHVEDIYTTDANGTPKDVFQKKETIYYRVQVLDQNDGAVEGANVDTEILKPSGQLWTTQSSDTGADGWALFSKTTNPAAPSGLHTINVTGVTKSGATYDPNANVKDTHQFELQ